MTSLKNVLLINAVSSGITGLGLVVAGKTVASLFGVSQPQAFWAVGFFLIAFAIFVFSEGVKDHPRASRVTLISTLDISWVIGSFLIVVLQLFDLSFIGYALTSAVALWVAAMAFLQLRGVKSQSHNVA